MEQKDKSEKSKVNTETEGRKKRILTGLKPSGTLHIGNYFGSLKPLVDLSLSTNDEVFLMVADYHALTSVHNKAELQNNTLNIVKDYLSAGADPERIILFRQSDNLHHFELNWIFNCHVTVPFLMQAHAYKDKVAKEQEANAGLFTYPMLMAADIALYNTDIVPVGEDQRQHVEYAREVIRKFNHTYGKTLREPKEQVVEIVKTIPGTDGQKMSKSYKNTIPLFGSEEEVRKAVMGIVTDSEGEKPENVYNIHKVVFEVLGRDFAQLDNLYEQNRGRYKPLKDALFEDLEQILKPLREKRKDISDEKVKKVLKAGAEKAIYESTKTINRVRDAIGINL